MHKLLLIASITACAAARAPQPTTPLHYACDDTELLRTGDQLVVTSNGAPANVKLGWADAVGEHFPASVGGQPIEYVIPRDRHADATTSRKGVCTARGGYTEAMALFAGGHSMADVAARFGLRDAREARVLVHDAMISVAHRYYADR